jgi:hypothetical protein
MSKVVVLSEITSADGHTKNFSAASVNSGTKLFEVWIMRFNVEADHVGIVKVRIPHGPTSCIHLSNSVSPNVTTQTSRHNGNRFVFLSVLASSTEMRDNMLMNNNGAYRR